MRTISNNDLLDLLSDVSEFLDNYVDVKDGADSQPVPNGALTLQMRVEEAFDGINMETPNDL